MATSYHPITWLLVKYGIKYISAAVVAIVYPAWRSFHNRRRHNSAQDWPTATAMVHDVRLEEIQDTGTWRATLVYSYFVDEYRSGEYVRGFNNEDAADAFKRQLKNRKLEVRHHPRKPNRSTLNEDEMQRIVDQSTYEQQFSSVPL